MTHEQIEQWRRRIRDVTLANYQYEMGVATDRSGETNTALAFYQRALEIRPDYPEAWFRLVRLLERLGRHDEAATQRRGIPAIDTDFELKACCAAAAAAICAEDSAGAAEALEAACRITPDRAAVQALTSLLAAFDTGTDAGGHKLEIGLDDWALPLVRDAFEAVAFRLSRRAAPDELLTLLEREAALCSDNARLLRMLGDAHYAVNNRAGAAKAYGLCVALEPGRADNLTKYGFMLQGMGDITGSIAALQAALALPDGASAPGIHVFLSNSLFALLRLDEAEALLRAVPPLLAASADILTQLGMVLSAQQRLDEAVTSLTRARSAAPASLVTAIQLTMAVLKTGDADAALKHARDTARLTGDGVPWGATLEGLVLQQMGRIDEALDIQRRAVAHAPGNTWVLINLGLALKAAERDEEAMAAFSAAATVPIENLWLPFQARLWPNWAMTILTGVYRQPNL